MMHGPMNIRFMVNRIRPSSGGAGSAFCSRLGTCEEVAICRRKRDMSDRGGGGAFRETKIVTAGKARKTVKRAFINIYT